MEKFLLIVIPLALIGGAIYLAWRSKQKKENANKTIDKFKEAQTAKCRISGIHDGVRFLAETPPDQFVLDAIADGWRRLDRVIDHYYLTHPNVAAARRENCELLLLNEELRSFYNQTPSLVEPIKCRKQFEGAGFCKTPDMPDYKVLKVNDRFEYDPNGRVPDPEVQVLTAAEAVRVETLKTNRQRWTVVIPKTRTEFDYYLIVNAVINGGEHEILANCDPALYNATIGAGADVHPSRPLDGVNPAMPNDATAMMLVQIQQFAAVPKNL